jgi:hypothetical protein
MFGTEVVEKNETNYMPNKIFAEMLRASKQLDKGQ